MKTKSKSNHLSTFAAIAIIAAVFIVVFCTGCRQTTCPAYSEKVVKQHEKYK